MSCCGNSNTCENNSTNESIIDLCSLLYSKTKEVDRVLSEEIDKTINLYINYSKEGRVEYKQLPNGFVTINLFGTEYMYDIMYIKDNNDVAPIYWLYTIKGTYEHMIINKSIFIPMHKYNMKSPQLLRILEINM